MEPPATNEELRAAALQFVRKISGMQRPSKTNEAAFQAAVDAITTVAQELIDTLEIQSAPRDREVEAEKARQRYARRQQATLQEA